MKTMIIAALCFSLIVLLTGCDRPDFPCSSFVGSPNGNVPFGKTACSPDKKMYAREIEPRNQGNIGIYDTNTDKMLKAVDVKQHPQGSSNDLKALAWSPDSKRLAVMYHYDGGGHISIMDVDSGEEIKRLVIKKFYHQMNFLPDGKRIQVESDTLEID